MNILSMEELEYHWTICSHICQRLEDTSMFVDHSMDESGVLIQGSVYSYEFRDILEITSEEFESVGKLLCKSIMGKNPEKIFEISPMHSSAIMINGNADFENVPIETLIREFRFKTDFRQIKTIEEIKTKFIGTNRDIKIRYKKCKKQLKLKNKKQKHTNYCSSMSRAN